MGHGHLRPVDHQVSSASPFQSGSGVWSPALAHTSSASVPVSNFCRSQQPPNETGRPPQSHSLKLPPKEQCREFCSPAPRLLCAPRASVWYPRPFTTWDWCHLPSLPQTPHTSFHLQALAHGILCVECLHLLKSPLSGSLPWLAQAWFTLLEAPTALPQCVFLGFCVYLSFRNTLLTVTHSGAFLECPLRGELLVAPVRLSQVQVQTWLCLLPAE